MDLADLTRDLEALQAEALASIGAAADVANLLRPCPDLRPEAPSRGRSVSTRVFHAPQPGHRPVQASATWPHS